MTNNSKVMKIVSGLVGVATVFSMLVGASAAAAQTTDSAALAAQIQALQAQLSAMNGTSASMSYTFSANLSLGSKGQDVWNLQKALNSWDGTHVAVTGAGSPGNETSTFGPATKKAVMKFQAKYGISQTGTVGPITRAKLNSLLSSSPVVTTPGQTPVVVSGPVSAMLSSDNPAAGYIINSQATADLEHITFTGNGVVNSVTLSRMGISDQNTLANVYLYDGATRLTDGYSFNSTGQIVINNLNIVVSGSKTIAVKADVYAHAADNSSTISVGLTGFTSGTNVNTANVWGNTFNVSVGNPATASFTAQSSMNVTSASINAGLTGYTFFRAPLQVNTRTMWLKSANFRMVGSAPIDALGNITLYVDGVSTGKTASVMTVNGSNYASFDFTAAPFALTTGSHTVEVRADVQKGSARNVTFSIQQAADFTVTDPQIGVNIAITGVPNTSGTITIGAGSATFVIDPAFQSLTNVTGGASNVVIGRFKAHAYGEDVKVSSLSVTPVLAGMTPSANGLQNVSLYFNGSQVGSQTATWTTGAILFNLGSQMILPAGQDSWIEVRADLRDQSGTNYTAGTVSTMVNSISGNAQGQISQDSSNVASFPGSTITTSGLTVQTALLSVAKNPAYANQNVNPNTAAVKIGSYVLQNQSSSESVRITGFTVGVTPGAPADIHNFAALTISTPGQTVNPIQPQTTNNVFSTNFTLAPGQTQTVDVLADTSTATGTVVTDLQVTSIGVTSNVSATSPDKTGQTITLASGSITTTPTLLTSSTVSQYVAAKGGLTDGTLASFKVVSNNGVSTISELTYNVNQASTTIASIRVGGVTAPVVNGLAYLTGLNISVPNGGSGVSLDTYASYSDVGVTGVPSGATSTITLAKIKYTSGGTTATLNTSATSSQMTSVASKPTITVSKPSAILSAGLMEAIDVTVAADARGSVTLNSLPITVALNNATASSTGANQIQVKDELGQTIATTNNALGNTTNFTVTINFTNGYEITPSTPKTFKIFVPVTAVNVGSLSGAQNSSMSTSLATTGFSWTDTAGNAASAQTSTALIPTYPNLTTEVIYN